MTKKGPDPADNESAEGRACDRHDDFADLPIRFQEPRGVLDLIEKEYARNQRGQFAGCTARLDECLGAFERVVIVYDLGVEVALHREALRHYRELRE